jgi:protein phosphatase
MRRRNNQDNHGVFLAGDETAWSKFGHLLIVADGMGAHAAGELASQLSVELIPHHYRKLVRGLHAEALHQALTETNAEIFRRGQANPEFRSMGTTTCVLAIVPEGALIAHVGDSRVYRLRGNQLEQLTFDHSLVWEMRASGELSEEAIRNSTIPKNVITRSLGPNASVMVDIEGPFPLQVGDKFLLCSDGLSGQLSDEEIGVLLQVLDRDTAVQAMVDIANLRGGPDNITVVVGEVTSDAIIESKALPSEGATRAAASFPIAFGIAAAVALLLSIVLLALQQFPIALLALAAAAVAFASGWYKYQSASIPNERPAGVHGKSPYRRVACKPDRGFTENLAQVVSELESWFDENHWSTASAELSAARDLAKKAQKEGRFADSIRSYVQVIMIMMREARVHQTAPPDDSETIDL